MAADLPDDPGHTIRAHELGERVFRLALEAVRAFVYASDLRTDRITFVHGLEELLGHDHAEARDRSWWRSLVHPDDDAVAFATAQAATEAGRPFELEYRVRNASGDWISVRENSQVVFNEADEPIAHVGVVQDVTERREQEHAARSTAERLQLALDAAQLGVWRYDRRTRQFAADERCQRLLAVPASSPSEDIIARVHPDDRSRVVAAFEQAAALDPGEYDTSHRFLFPDGSIRWLKVMARHEIDSGGESTGLVGIVQDVTASRRNAQALRESEARLRLALAGGRMGTWEADLDHDVGLVDARAARLVGLPEAALAMPIADYLEMIHVNDRERVLEAARRASATGGDFIDEFRIRDDGGSRWLSIRGRALAGADERRRLTGVCFDTTEEREAEERLRRLTGELSHRVKNNLATVLSIANRTARGSDSIEEFLEDFRGRLRALSQAHVLLASRGWRSADLRELVHRVLSALRDERFGCDGPEVRIAPRIATTLSLVLHELGTNALQHGALAARGGRVHLAWQLDPGDSGAAHLKLVWSERGGPPVEPPPRQGFGLRLIESAIPYELDGTAEIAFPPEGLRCSLRFPLEGSLPQRHG
jgi:PAS domain S-box-containing protein